MRVCPGRRDALAKGESTYVGSPCKRGHTGPRSTKDRHCIECRRLWDNTPEQREKRNSNQKGRKRIRPKNHSKINHYKYNYGITLAERDQMFINQSYLCPICSTLLNPKEIRSVHVDHCHATGKVRGILCLKCNLGLGYFRDSEEFLSSAIEYLRKTK